MNHSISLSSSSDDFTCDASLMVQNETLKKEVNELTCTLEKAHEKLGKAHKKLEKGSFLFA